MKYLIKYNSFNEGIKEIIIGLSALFNVGITNISDAQEISKSQDKLALVDVVSNYNTQSKSDSSLTLKDFMRNKIDIKDFNVDDFKNKYLIQKQDKTYIFNSNFINNSIIKYPGGYSYVLNIGNKFGITANPNYVGYTYKIGIPSKKGKFN